MEPFLYQTRERALDALNALYAIEGNEAYYSARQLIERQIKCLDLIEEYEDWQSTADGITAYIDDYDGTPIFNLHGMDNDEVLDLSNRIDCYGSNYVAAETLTFGCLLLTKFVATLKEIAQ